MIRVLKPSDNPQIMSLWRTCFGDTDEYIRSFLFALGTADSGLAIELDGRVASMLFMLPAKMNVMGKARELIYIYACATSPEHRGKGLMRDLLEAAYDCAKAQSALGLILVPASERLSAYYQKLGFESCFRKNEFELPEVDKRLALPIDDDAISQMISIRKRILKTDFAIQWPDHHLRFALNELAQDGGKALIDGDSYLLLSADNRVIEALPLEKYRQQTDEEFALIRFCERSEILRTSKPYFNFGLD